MRMLQLLKVATAATLGMYACASGPPAYWLPISSEATLLRSDGGANGHATITDALHAYRDRDAAAAVEELKGFPAPPIDPTIKTVRDLYLASALLNAGRPEEALTTLEPLGVAFMPQPWRNHAQWIQVMALDEMSRFEEANAILEQLAEDPGKSGDRARAKLKHRPKL